MIQKFFHASFDAIDSLTAPQTLKLETDHYLLNGYDILIGKAETGFSAKINFMPFKGYSSSQMHTIEFSEPIKLLNKDKNLFLPEKSIYLNQFFTDFNSDDPTIEIKGNISQISTCAQNTDFDNTYLRLIIPVDSDDKLRNVRGWGFKTDLKSKNRNLIKVNIRNAEYHFFEFKTDSAAYLVVDTTEHSNDSEFKKISHAILLAQGFLYGNLYLSEGYMLSSQSADFADIKNVSFSTYRESIMTGYRIHTTNAYSVYNMTGKTEEEISAKQEEVQEWINDIIEIEEPIFSALSELFYKSEPISRAAIVTLQGNLLSLEIKGSAYSLALEAITKVIMDEHKEDRPKPVSAPIFKKLKEKIYSLLDEILPEGPENAITRKILNDRLNNWNSPTNADKLKKSFHFVDYELNEYEINALKARDKFQHGELPVSDNADDVVFKEVYFMCLIMHRLIYVLILKRIGYSGYIINYPQMHSYITKRDLKEKLFYKL